MPKYQRLQTALTNIYETHIAEKLKMKITDVYCDSLPRCGEQAASVTILQMERNVSNVSNVSCLGSRT